MRHRYIADHFFDSSEDATNKFSLEGIARDTVAWFGEDESLAIVLFPIEHVLFACAIFFSAAAVILSDRFLILFDSQL